MSTHHTRLKGAGQAAALAALRVDMGNLDHELNYTLRPMLRAMELLIGLHRVHEALEVAASGDKNIATMLNSACPTWRDPNCEGASLDTIIDMARVSAEFADRLGSDSELIHMAFEMVAADRLGDSA